MATPALAESIAPIGVESLEVSATNRNGSPDVQAGSHPYELVTRFLLSKPVKAGSLAYLPAGGGLKDVHTELPPGFVGNPNVTPKCSYQAFVERECPNDTAVGVATTRLFDGSETYENSKGEEVPDGHVVSDPVYNLETPGGVAAEFAWDANEVTPIYLDASVRTGSDYGITATVGNVPEVLAVLGSTVRIWGVPADPSHDKIRGACLGKGENTFHEEEETRGPHDEEESLGECPVNVPEQPLLTNPTSCGVPRAVTMSVDGWAQPGAFASREAQLPELSGCEDLDFSPTIAVTPDGSAGSTPTGLNVEVKVPQESTTNPVGLGEADVKNTTVTLPPGVQISPSAADGLQACSNAQIGFEGDRKLDESGTSTPIFKEKLYNPTTQKEEATLCPDASKIATVHIATPLLEGELTGEVYLAAPQNFSGLPENPFSSLIAMYLVAEEPEHGVLVKLPGKVSLNEATGQIESTFADTPQLPFSDLKLEFFGGERAPLATPALCGTYTTQTSFEPWSVADPANAGEVKHPSSSLQVSSGPGGAPCSDPPPFSPSLQSGSTNINAGSFSNLTTTLSREDGQQSIQQVTLHYPPGLSGLLSGVKLCGEAQANAGTCGPESQIGETTVSVGLGSDPFSVVGGKVYLTEKIAGSPPDDPFGLSIVNPAKAGPFVLQHGEPVVVRATIEVNPLTAALTVTTNGASQGGRGNYSIPTMIEGIPLQIKHVNVLVNRPGFTFNPTDCNPAHVTGTVNSAEGASSPVSIPFQVTNCASLKFAPKISFSTSGKTSKADGASLTTKIAYPGPFDYYANIAKVKVELPKALPSRLTTLQKACTQAQFRANPAGCPSASVIGHAKAITPLLPVPLEGPAYFVSNGGEAFPNLIMVLQGYGVRIDLVGDTFISKSGITSSTFKTVPDQPVTSFELTLPQGPYSALAANGNLCKETTTKTVSKKVTVKVKGRKKTVTRKVEQAVATTLEIPNEFVGQNGAVLKQVTDIGVTGCPKAKSAKKAKKAKKKHHKKK